MDQQDTPSPAPAAVDVEKLRGLASRATPGPWEQDSANVELVATRGPDGGAYVYVASTECDIWVEARPPGAAAHDAAYIAAASPDVVLGLLARIAALEAENEKLREALKPFAGAYARLRHFGDEPSDDTPLMAGSYSSYELLHGGDPLNGGEQQVTVRHLCDAAALEPPR